MYIVPPAWNLLLYILQSACIQVLNAPRIVTHYTTFPEGANTYISPLIIDHPTKSTKVVHMTPGQ